MNIREITDRMQGLLDELVRAEPVTDAARLVATKAAYTERVTALLQEFDAPAEQVPMKPVVTLHAKRAGGSNGKSR